MSCRLLRGHSQHQSDFSETRRRKEGHALGKATPPFEERVPLLPLELDRRHVARPGRATGHLQALAVCRLLAAELSLLLRRQEVGVVRSGRVEVGVRDDDLDVLALCVAAGITMSASRRTRRHDRAKRGAPAEKSVSASWAVLRNSSRSFSCVTEERPASIVEVFCFNGDGGSTWLLANAGAGQHECSSRGSGRGHREQRESCG